MRQLFFAIFLLAWSPFAIAGPLRYQFDLTVASLTGEAPSGRQIRLEIDDLAQFDPVPDFYASAAVS